MRNRQSPRTVAVQHWENNHTQFARLLAEIAAVGLNKAQRRLLCESMDTDVDRLNELLERASCEWDTRIKNNRGCRQRTPARHLATYCGGTIS